MAEDKKAWVIGYANDSSGEVVIHQGHLGFPICRINFGTKDMKRSLEMALRICRAVNLLEGRSGVEPFDAHTLTVLGRVSGKSWTVSKFVEGMMYAKLTFWGKVRWKLWKFFH